MKSSRVIFRSAELLFLWLSGSSAYSSLMAKSELGASPSAIRGRMISSASSSPEPSSSHEMKRFLANSMFLRLVSSRSFSYGSFLCLISSNLRCLTHLPWSTPRMKVRAGSFLLPNLALTCSDLTSAIFSSICS